MGLTTSQGQASSESTNVIGMANKQQLSDSEHAEIDAFEQVMSQMNIADRVAFENQYSQLWQEASEADELLAVLMCEIDFFTEYHDNYGHQAASFMLLVVGLALKKICEKQGCFLAHYKNDNFAIIMKGNSESEISEVSESLRQAVEASRTEHHYSDISNIVTMSIGASSVYPTSMQIMLNKSVAALSVAKESGHNQVCDNYFVQQSVDTPESPCATEVSNKEEETQVLVRNTEADINSDLAPLTSDNEIIFAKEKLIIKNDAHAEFENGSYKETMRDMGITDRIAFHHNYLRTWQESKEEQDLLSLFICEVDCFSTYVKNYGVAASEDILIIMASILQEKSEKFAYSGFHIGDEKFAILLKGGNATKALRIAEGLHKMIASASLEHKYSEVSDIISISIGLASVFPAELTSNDILMKEASGALKAAVSNGRNQTGVNK